MKSRYHYIEVNPDGEVLKNFFFWVGSRKRRQIHKLNSRRSELVYICPSCRASLDLAYNAENLGSVPMQCVQFSELLKSHPDAKSIKTHPTVYQQFVRDVFFESQRKFEDFEHSMFSNPDYKQFLMDYFGINL